VSLNQEHSNISDFCVVSTALIDISRVVLQKEEENTLESLTRMWATDGPQTTVKIRNQRSRLAP